MGSCLVFICHPTQDNDRADQLAAALGAKGLRPDQIFADHQPSSIRLATLWEPTIDTALDDAVLVVALVSDAFFKSEQSQIEAERAEARGALLRVFIARPEEAREKAPYLGRPQGVVWGGDPEAVADAIVGELAQRDSAPAPPPGEEYRVIASEDWSPSARKLDDALRGALASWDVPARALSTTDSGWRVELTWPDVVWHMDGRVTIGRGVGLELAFPEPNHSGSLLIVNLLLRAALWSCVLSRAALNSGMNPGSKAYVSVVFPRAESWGGHIHAVNFDPGGPSHPYLAHSIEGVGLIGVLGLGAEDPRLKSACIDLWDDLAYAWSWGKEGRRSLALTDTGREGLFQTLRLGAGELRPADRW